MSAEWLLRSLLQVCGAVAQLVARLVRIEKVRGSIPLSSTKPYLCEPTPTRSSSGFLVLPPAVTPATVRPGRPRARRGAGGVPSGVLGAGRCRGAFGTFWAFPVAASQLGASSWANGSVSSARSTLPSLSMISLRKKPWLICRGSSRRGRRRCFSMSDMIPGKALGPLAQFLLSTRGFGSEQSSARESQTDTEGADTRGLREAFRV